MVTEKKKVKLNTLVLLLLFFAIFSTFLSDIVSSYSINRRNIIHSTLTLNEIYAKKIATTTEVVFKNMNKNLEILSMELPEIFDKPLLVSTKLSRHLRSTDLFNSMIVVDKDGFVVTSAPTQSMEGIRLNTPGALEALQLKKPAVSAPYIAVTNRLIVLVSFPIIDNNGVYWGFVAGTVYLQDGNILQELLGKHPYDDGSYLYVVDRGGNLIYHPLNERIGDNVLKKNDVVDKVIKGNEGAEGVVNSKGVSMLAGYAYVPISKWGVISQTPLVATVEPTLLLVKELLLKTLPIILALMLVSFYILQKIITPLRQLTTYATDIRKKTSITPPRIRAWYYEIFELKQTIFIAFKYLENQALVDGLTKLQNRRALDQGLGNLVHTEKIVSLILLDIDNFKSINDNYGHQIGDDVLRFLANTLTTTVRDIDKCFRYGGEEFLIILPETDLSTAEIIAERVRMAVSSVESPTGAKITISLGVGNYPDSTVDVDKLFPLIDKALYQAKRNGKNQVVSTDHIDM
jgi:diguanylate cyclase (GGDEF)-like protein